MSAVTRALRASLESCARHRPSASFRRKSANPTNSSVAKAAWKTTSASERSAASLSATAAASACGSLDETFAT